MKKSRISLLFYLCLPFAAFDASSQTVNQFSIQQAVEYARKNSVQVKNALLDVLIQQQTNRDITSIALPQINATAGVNDNTDIQTTLVPASFFGGPPGTFAPAKFGTAWNANLTIAFSQIIFDGQVFIALKARNGTMDLQKAILGITEENIKATIYKVYYQLVLSKTQIGLLDANIERLQKLNHDVTIMYNNGFTEKIDIDKLTVQIANLETEKLKALDMIRNGYSGLKVLMGMPVKDSLVLTDTLSDEQIKDAILENTQYNYNDRKDYQSMVITNKLNGLNIRRYKLMQIPTFSIVGNYVKQAQRDKFDFFGKGDWFTNSYIGLHMSVPIFNGLSLKAKKQGARLQLQKTQNQTEALKNNIDKEVADAKNNFATAIYSMDFQKKNMALAEKVYNQAKKKYEIGTGSATEINTAQLDLKTAQTNYITSMYDAIIARIDFLKATGKL